MKFYKNMKLNVTNKSPSTTFCAVFCFFILSILSGSVSSQVSANIDSLLVRLNNPNVEEKVNAYADVIVYYNRAKPEKSLEYGEKALGIARASGNKKGEAQILYLIGIAYHSQSNYQKAMDYYQLAYAIRKKINDKVGIGECLNRIALIYNVRGEYEKALEYCFESIKILENENDMKALTRSYNHLGILYYILGDIEKAKENSQRALKSSEALNDDLILAVSHEHLSVIYIKTKEYDKALYHVQKSLDLRIPHNDKVGIAGSYENLAIIYRNTKKYDEALKYYTKSLELKKEINNKRGAASSISGIGLTYFNMGQYEKSIEYIEQALELRKKLGDKRGIVSSYTRLADNYSAQQDYKTALEYHKLARSLSDSLLNEQKNKVVAEYQAKYKNEMLDRKILVLQQENTLQKYLRNFLLVSIVLLIGFAISIFFALRSKRKMNRFLVEHNNQVIEQKEELQRLNEQLKEVISTKDKFFSIIAHDLKSPFQGLLGYSQILSTEYSTLTEEEKMTFIQSIEELSQNSFRLLENLLEWSRLQTGKIVFAPEEHNLLLELFPTLSLLKQTAQNKQITLEYTIANSIIVKADKNMLTTILRNLVSNSIKFTKSGGRITIEAKPVDTFVVFSIADTGIGMRKDVVDNLFNVGKSISTRGTANEEGTGLGLSLCKEMIALHGGRIWVESEIERGTTFYFTLPLE
ncbi:MAG: tetratricopeptide repeat protein [Ignavibacteria bacterium]|nr:tetratricopeptide repeat protein [Ignavibacteria bacterium]